MALIQFTCWNVDLPIWQMKVTMWYCWILEVFFFSTGVCFLIPYFCLHSTNNIYLCTFCFRSKRSSVLTTEWILELPHFTVQATRAQTLLLQAICHSWSHSVYNSMPTSLSENLLNEVYKPPGKQNTTPHFGSHRRRLDSVGVTRVFKKGT